MFDKTSTTLLCALLAVPLAGETRAQTECIPGPSLQVTDDGVEDDPPRIHAGSVVWSSPLDGDHEIFLRRGDELLQITDNGLDDIDPWIHDGGIVWVGMEPGGDGEIFYWDGQNVIQLTDNPTDDDQPRIHDGNVVWRGWDGSDLARP